TGVQTCALPILLQCGPEALRAQKALLRQWEELPLKQSVDLSIGVFGQSFLTGEPQRLMQGFIDRKRSHETTRSQHAPRMRAIQYALPCDSRRQRLPARPLYGVL